MLLAAAAPATAAAGAAVMSLPSLGAGEHAGGSAKPNGSGCVGGAEAARAGRAIVAAAEVAAPFGGGVCAIDASTLQAGPAAAAVSPACSDRAVAPSTPAARSFIDPIQQLDEGRAVLHSHLGVREQRAATHEAKALGLARTLREA